MVVRHIARGWPGLAAVALAAVLLGPVLVTRMFGQLSRRLPPGAFSDAAGDKDQVAALGVQASPFGAVIAAAGIVTMAGRLIRRRAAKDRRTGGDGPVRPVGRFGGTSMMRARHGWA